MLARATDSVFVLVEGLAMRRTRRIVKWSASIAVVGFVLGGLASLGPTGERDDESKPRGKGQ